MAVDHLMDVLRQNLQQQARRHMTWFQDQLIVFDDSREEPFLLENCVGYDGTINLRELAEAIEKARVAG